MDSNEELKEINPDEDVVTESQATETQQQVMERTTPDQQQHQEQEVIKEPIEAQIINQEEVEQQKDDNNLNEQIGQFKEDENEALKDEGEISEQLTASTTANLQPTATVKVLLVPLGQTITHAYALKTKISEIKETFSKELRVPSKVLHFVHGISSMF